MNRRWLALGGVALAAGAAGLALRLRRDSAAPEFTAKPGGGPGTAAGTAATEPAGVSPDAVTPADFWSRSVERLDGSTLALSSFKGRRLIVNFWATWCPPCLREMPLIESFHRQFGPHAGPGGWHVLGLAIDRREPVQQFLKRQPVSYEIALAGLDGTELVRALGNVAGGLPFTVVFDAQSNVLHRKLGELKEADLRSWVGS